MALQPVYGHSETSPRQYEDIMLDQLALTTGSQVDDHTLPKQIPQVTGSWQAIEGVKLSDAECELMGAVKGVELGDAECESMGAVKGWS